MLLAVNAVSCLMGPWVTASSDTQASICPAPFTHTSILTLTVPLCLSFNLFCQQAPHAPVNNRRLYTVAQRASSLHFVPAILIDALSCSFVGLLPFSVLSWVTLLLHDTIWLCIFLSGSVDTLCNSKAGIFWVSTLAQALKLKGQVTQKWKFTHYLLATMLMEGWD